MQNIDFETLPIGAQLRIRRAHAKVKQVDVARKSGLSTQKG